MFYEFNLPKPFLNISKPWEKKNLSVGYHLGIFKYGVSLEGLFKWVDWNHNPIVLLEGLFWKPWISGTLSLVLKLEESKRRWEMSNYYKNLVFAFSLPYSFTLYAIAFILFYYIFAYNCLLYSHNLHLQKKSPSPYSLPFRVITLG